MYVILFDVASSRRLRSELRMVYMFSLFYSQVTDSLNTIARNTCEERMKVMALIVISEVGVCWLHFTQLMALPTYSPVWQEAKQAFCSLFTYFSLLHCLEQVLNS